MGSQMLRPSVLEALGKVPARKSLGNTNGKAPNSARDGVIDSSRADVVVRASGDQQRRTRDPARDPIGNRLLLRLLHGQVDLRPVLKREAFHGER
jgi:hypothetical protein